MMMATDAVSTEDQERGCEHDAEDHLNSLIVMADLVSNRRLRVVMEDSR